MKRFEAGFEALLWRSRLVVLAAVIASAVLALIVFYISTVDVTYLFAYVGHYTDPGLSLSARADARVEMIAQVVDIIEGYLLATILLIFALGLYELFIGKIDRAEGSEFASRLLLIGSLDDLKDRLTKVVLVMLIVKFFQQALRLKYDTAIDLMQLAAGILFVGGALYLTKSRGGGH